MDDDAETSLYSLLREPIAAVMGAWPFVLPLVPAPPVRMLEGLACTWAVLGA